MLRLLRSRCAKLSSSIFQLSAIAALSTELARMPASAGECLAMSRLPPRVGDRSHTLRSRKCKWPDNRAEASLRAQPPVLDQASGHNADSVAEPDQDDPPPALLLNHMAPLLQSLGYKIEKGVRPLSVTENVREKGV